MDSVIDILKHWEEFWEPMRHPDYWIHGVAPDVRITPKTRIIIMNRTKPKGV